MNSIDKFSSIVLGINKNIIRVLIGIMTLSLILGTANLIYLEFVKIINHPYFLVDVSTLFEVFNLILVIAIGYELIRSLILIISSDTVPTIPIIQIAIIAVANKIITLDIKQTNVNILIGLALLIAALGLAYFLMKFHKTTVNDSENERTVQATDSMDANLKDKKKDFKLNHT